MNLQDYHHWIGIARRYTRVADEAEDLLQDALVVAAQRDRLDLSVEGYRRWLTGTIRHLATQTARTAARRRRRESAASEAPPAPEGGLFGVPSVPAWLDGLPPAARRVLVLALHGLQSAEIQSALRLSPTAYRQRLTTLRKHIGTLPRDCWQDAREQAGSRQRARGVGLDLGLIRRALLRRLQAETPGSIGTHDPDGHMIVLSSR